MTNPRHATFIFVTGPPASGKTTLSRALSEQLDYYHLDVNAYLNDVAMTPNHPLIPYCGTNPTMVRQVLEQRGVHGPGVVLSILILKIHQESQRLQAAGRRPKFILDGFPATEDEANVFAYFSGAPQAIVALHCPVELLQHRLRHAYVPNFWIQQRLALFQSHTRPFIARVSIDPRYMFINTANSLEYCKERALQAIGQAWVEDVEDEGEPADAA